MFYCKYKKNIELFQSLMPNKNNNLIECIQGLYNGSAR